MQASKLGPQPKPRGDRLKVLPVELIDKILTHGLCEFPRPDTSDQTNDGRYIGEYNQLAKIPWNIDTRILRHPDPEVRLRARRVMLTTNQFIYIKSHSVNLLPIFHAAQIPIISPNFEPIAQHDVEELSEYFILTHQIERLGGVKSSITSTVKPWGRTLDSLKRLSLVDDGPPQLQEFVIFRRDLDFFCRGLDGADSGYYHFGACTRHILTFHGPFDEILAEDIPILDPSNFLKPYLDTLRGFENFTIQGRIKPQLVRDIETGVKHQIATPRPEEVIEDANRQMGQADEYLSLSRPIQAAHTYARAAQGFLCLYSKGTLPRDGCGRPLSQLAELYFLLDMRQATAWLAVMQKRHDAAQGATRNTPDSARAQDGQPEEPYGDPEQYSSLMDLVRNLVIRNDRPRPLEHMPSRYQYATQLYLMAKADRLGDRNTFFTWKNINNALRVAPGDEEFRREAKLINGRMIPWQRRWIPE